MLTVWDQTNLIVALVFYTTASNTGIHKWATKLLENKLWRKVFFLACHHLLELIDGAVWEQLFGNVKSPENPKLKEAWSGINMKNLNTLTPRTRQNSWLCYVIQIFLQPWNLVHETVEGCQLELILRVLNISVAQ